MDGFNVSKIIFGLQHPEILFKKLYHIEQNKVQKFETQTFLPNTKPQNQNVTQNTGNMQNIQTLAEQLQMNSLPNMERSAFIRNLFNFPPNLGDMLLTLQNPKLPISGGTLGLAGINQELLQNQKAIADIFEEKPPTMVNAELTNIAKQVQNIKLQQDTVALFFSGMVSMNDVSKLILENGRHAVATLIIAMASASKQGMDSEQIQKTLSIVNSCISMAESNNPAQTLKSLMMLYIPWLPLNDSVGFDLEVTQPDGENELNNSKLIVLIQTKNYGNVKGEFILTTSNSVDVLILCTEGFPKKTLLDNLNYESTSHAMNTNIDIEEVKTNNEKKTVQETKVNLSATNEMNPYLLLMAHSFIRNTIMIDNNTSLDTSE